MFKFKGTCTKEVAIIIDISEKVIPTNIMSCIYLWYKK